MLTLRGQSVAVGMVVVAVVVFGLSGVSWAKNVRTRMHKPQHSTAKMVTFPSGEQVVPGTMPDQLSDAVEPEGAKEYRLRMSNLHTGENIDLVYRIGNTYVPAALEKLNHFLRDHNTQDVTEYDPKEFDVLHALMARVGRLNGLIDIVCGYRTPETNQALRHNSPWTGVAQHSQHMEGHAIDLRVPGVSTAELRNAALSLHAGGVGYYPVSQFVHVDVGPVREWAFGRAPRRVGRHGMSAGM